MIEMPNAPNPGDGLRLQVGDNQIICIAVRLLTPPPGAQFERALAVHYISTIPMPYGNPARWSEGKYDDRAMGR